jgi:signal transduction histidine kinase
VGSQSNCDRYNNIVVFLHYHYCVVVGIAIEDQPKMFKQFTQFNRNLLQGGGGSGLALWICKNLASFHGGRMVDTSTCNNRYPSLYM